MLSNSVVEAFVVGIFLADISVSVPAPTPQDACVDHYPSCKDFKGWGCGGQYEEWASYNCAKTCGLCDKKSFTHGTLIPLTETQPVQQCNDMIPNCKQYGQSVCSNNQYRVWAQDNCASYCNLCGINVCQDKLSNCDMYGSYSCGGQYRSWALENCAFTCKLCDL